MATIALTDIMTIATLNFNIRVSRPVRRPRILHTCAIMMLEEIKTQSNKISLEKQKSTRGLRNKSSPYYRRRSYRRINDDTTPIKERICSTKGNGNRENQTKPRVKNDPMSRFPVSSEVAQRRNSTPIDSKDQKASKKCCDGIKEQNIHPDGPCNRSLKHEIVWIDREVQHNPNGRRGN